MSTSTTDTEQGSSMSTADIKAHIAVMFADDPQPALPPARIATRGSRGPRVSP
ncbi:hypothetical protein BKP42_68110 [Rhodococcus erythropolis]|uniref:hypothetical protein n=1 Tax=Rhodococcus erythropolis TaxID=1833 RepID=UPI00155757C2|nr:hypothetical protein [Rhodococcus erythropolis]PBI83252.1 hypothetical protein BKP42_68110 [Rhodococcus erythropolis]